MSSISDFLPRPKNTHVKKNKIDEEDHRVYGSESDEEPSSSVVAVNGASGKKTNALTVRLDNEGQVDYSVIAKAGHGESRVVQSTYDELVPLRQRVDSGEISLSKPGAEEAHRTAAATKAAIDKLLSGKVEASKSASIAKKPGEATYVRYTPGNQMGEGSEVQHRQRIIKMVDVAQDPLEPPKFKKTKVPRGPPSPPPPVMRSPPRKLTVADQEDWYIPPAISNWKNPKGYTIALDKRLASGSHGLQDVSINDNKAKLAEALYAAERGAREEIRDRAAMQKRLAEKENAAKEERLRELARKAREERGNRFVGTERPAPKSSGLVEDYSDSDEDEQETTGERRRREEREERKREAEKELRMSRMGTERRIKTMAKEQDRDISEKVALGLAKPSQPTGEAQFDSRLFSQVGSVASKYNEDQIYDKSLFAAQEAVQSIYRPRVGGAADDGEEEMNKISSESRFEGLGSSQSAPGKQETREGPVEFEREEDPFGLDTMVREETKYGLQEEESKAKRQRTE